MSASTSNVEVVELEKRVARLEEIVAALAKKLDVRTDNPNDRKSVTSKVAYDWQTR